MSPYHCESVSLCEVFLSCECEFEICLSAVGVSRFGCVSVTVWVVLFFSVGEFCVSECQYMS